MNPVLPGLPVPRESKTYEPLRPNFLRLPRALDAPIDLLFEGVEPGP